MANRDTDRQPAEQGDTTGDEERLRGGMSETDEEDDDFDVDVEDDEEDEGESEGSF
jgi:hypothetical protein